MKIIGKVLFYKMLADIPVGTTVYVDEYGIVLYNNQLLLCVQYPYAEKYSMESGHVIPITRTSQDEDGFLIDFTKVSLHLPQRTLSLQDWKECLADKGEYIGPYQVETIEYNPKDYAEVYSRFSFSELLGELILINSSLFLGKDVDECKIQLKVLKRFFRKELESTSIEVLREMKNQFSMDLFEGESMPARVTKNFTILCSLS